MLYIFKEIKNLDEIISTYISMKIKDVKLFLSRGAILAKTYFVVGLLAIIIYYYTTTSKVFLVTWISAILSAIMLKQLLLLLLWKLIIGPNKARQFFKQAYASPDVINDFIFTRKNYFKRLREEDKRIFARY